MKKILLIASVLIVSGIAFSAGLSDSADLKVNARIVKPLSVTTEPLDFGLIPIGAYGEVDDMDPAKTGKVIVTGSPNSTVKIEISDLSGYPSTYFGGITLLNTVGNSSDVNNRLTAQLSFNETSEDSDHGFRDRLHKNGSSIKLSTEGKRSVYVGGYTQVVPNTQNGGAYVGTMTIKATYEPFGN